MAEVVCHGLGLVDVVVVQLMCVAAVIVVAMEVVHARITGS